ncbi:hypothetical protein [Streptomyces sp. NPDC059385]|uniref:hypothetical protein n=1 Tax=Streptomyces sp. NPDC059385 TaxID=3346817 RepID=UPI0036DAFE2F
MRYLHASPGSKSTSWRSAAPSPVLVESEEAQRGRRLALLWAALQEHAAAYNLRTVMTFHQRVEEAAAFAEKLPKSSLDAEFFQGLRSHDGRLVEQLASRALSSGKRKLHVGCDEDGQIVGAGGAGDGEDQQAGADAAARSALFHFSSPRDAATIAAFLRTRVYRPESLAWLGGYQAVLRWRAENEITSVHAVPYDTETEVGVTTAKLAALRSYGRATGHLAPRQDAMWGEHDEMGPAGQHMANLRRKGAKNGLGKGPAYSWTATTSDDGSSSRSSRPPGRGPCPSSGSG